MNAATEILLYLIRNIGALLLIVVYCAACCTHRALTFITRFHNSLSD